MLSKSKRKIFAALARGAAGFLLGAVLWFAAAAPYHRATAAPAQFLIRLFESPAETSLEVSGPRVIVNRDDFPESSERPDIPAGDLDFNIVILTTLFAVAKRPLSDSNLKRFAAAAGILYATHVLALVFKVETLYAMNLGAWSAAHYGTVARNFWATGTHFYRVVGMFAIPFVLWWALAERNPARRAIV